jgi:UDP-N-acetylmuramyl pentapeptide phosphotransferase/UDP-N-acetylglucosamine-1-phosphate transferase
MPFGHGVVALTSENRWLLVFTVVAAIVLVGGAAARRAARRNSTDSGNGRGVRRRAGALVALGPLIGLALAPSPGTLAVVAAVGGALLAVVGMAVERTKRADRSTMAATVAAAAVAVIAGARFGPTGVEALDVILAFVFLVAVTQAADGLGNVDGLAAGIGAASAGGLFALAGFGGQDSLATVALGLLASCFGFLAFNLRPASLFIGRGGRLAIGYTLGVGALAVHVVPSAPRELLTPLMLTGVLLVDAAVVVVDRLRRRRPLAVHRPDHLVHRLAVLGWTAGEAVILLVIAQVLLSAIGVFTGRAVMPLWLGAASAALVVMMLAVEAARAELDRDRAPGFTRWVKLVIGAACLFVVAGIAPLAFVADDARTDMESGREAASRALAAARDGDTITASAGFREAALTFERARDQLDSPTLAPGLAVPFLAPNVRAARTMAEIGADLANAGESVTIAVDPEALSVVNGRLPLEEVRKVTPKLRAGAGVLASAHRRLDDVRDDPYLLPPVRDAVRKVHAQLAQADREAQHAAAAAELASAIFGGDGVRHYLLVVQNNAVRAVPDVSFDAPADYRTRYTQFAPATTLQNINLSPDFPSVARALMSLAPQAGVGEVDGVLAVDPEGLAALLELTGPVDVTGWPTPITAQNVVDVTLRDAYAAFEDTPERADFLGDVAQVAVDTATNGNLGRPAHIAQVLGGAAHEGHLVLAFARPEEQELADELGVAGRLEPVRSDAVAVTSSNAAANKIDWYLHRSVSYEVRLDPNVRATSAQASGNLEVALDNTAPAEGLPQIVIGPFDPRFYAGESRSFVSLYSPLRISDATMNGTATAVGPGRERGRNVYSVFADMPARSTTKIEATLTGRVKLHRGWYAVSVRHQPTLNADRLHVSVDVPEGWRIDKAPGMERPFARRASVTVDLERTKNFRVHVIREPSTWDLWSRLETGT